MAYSKYLTDMELKKYLVKRNEELKQDADEIKKFNDGKVGAMSNRVYLEQIKDNERLLKELGDE